MLSYLGGSALAGNSITMFALPLPGEESTKPMEILISEEALDLIRQRGRAAAVDFIPPIG